MNMLLLLALSLASPFEDTQSRFSLDLPSGWVFTPQPGDTGGAYFRRINEGMLANATVRVMQFSGPVDLAAFGARIAAASDQEPGFHLLNSERITLAGVPALKRRFVVYINGDNKWSKLVEQRILVVGTRGYVLHAETVADAFGSFSADFDKFFANFRPLTGERAIPVSATPAKAVAKLRAHRVDMSKLTGRWEGGGHAMRLSPGGVVIIDGLHGSYRIDGGVMVFMLGEDQRIYEFQMLSDTQLRLTGGAFGEGQTFHHVMAPPDQE